MIESINVFLGEPPVAVQTAWTVPEGHTAIIRKLILANHSGVSKNFSLRFVPSGENPIDSHWLFRNYQVPDTTSTGPKLFDLEQVVSGGWRVQWEGVAGVIASLNGIRTDQ